MAGGADTADQQPDTTGREALQRTGSRQHTDHAEGQYDQQELLTETHRQNDRSRRENRAGENNRAENASKQGGGEGRPQCAGAFAALCHWKAVRRSPVIPPSGMPSNRWECVRRDRWRSSPIIESAWDSSIPKTNGSTIDSPAIPPRPGRIPTSIPSSAPSVRKNKLRWGEHIDQRLKEELNKSFACDGRIPPANRKERISG